MNLTKCLLCLVLSTPLQLRSKSNSSEAVVVFFCANFFFANVYKYECFVTHLKVSFAKVKLSRISKCKTQLISLCQKENYVFINILSIVKGRILMVSYELLALQYVCVLEKHSSGIKDLFSMKCSSKMIFGILRPMVFFHF